MKQMILILILSLLTGCFSAQSAQKSGPLFHPSRKPVEIAVFGADTSGTDTDMNRSDMIRIIRIIPEENTVKILAVQRDTMALIPGYGFTKINRAHDMGGGTSALAALNANLDLRITEYVSFSFESLITLADLIDGVELELSAQEALMLYGIGPEGSYHLDGKQLLAFCRMRKTDDDWHRMERQNRVIRAILRKMKGSSLSELCAIFRRLSSTADFHLSPESLRMTAEMMKKGNMKILTETFPFSPSAIARNLTIDGIDQIYELHDLRAEVCQAHRWLYETDGCVLSPAFEELAGSMYEQYPVDGEESAHQ